MSSLPQIRPEVFRRAIAIYMEHAYPAGAPPAAVRARLQAVEGADRPIDPTRAPFEPIRPADADGATGPVYALRLGNHAYPHMKLQIQPWPDEAGFLVSVNSHDQVLAPDPASPDAEGVRRLQAENNRIKLAIEAAWEAAGMPTFLAYLRDYLRTDRPQHPAD